MTPQTRIADGIYQHGFHIIDNFLAQDDYRALCATIRNTHEDGHFKPAKIGQKSDENHNATIRNDNIFWLDNQMGDNAVNTYLSEIKKLSETLNQSLFLGLVDYEAHFSIYQPNHFYKKHIDQFASTQDRRISCVYYLNDGWKQTFGGELRLYNKEDQLLSNIQPLGNRFVCFNSDIPHEVCTTHRLRYSIAAWLKIRPMALVV